MRRQLEIVEPCGAAWQQMSGTAAQRHCDHCDKTVHSLTEMPAAAAAELLATAAPRSICVRVRCNSQGLALFDAGSGPRPSQLRVLLAPALLSAASLLACQQPGGTGADLATGPAESTAPSSLALPAPEPAFTAPAAAAPAAAAEALPPAVSVDASPGLAPLGEHPVRALGHAARHKAATPTRPRRHRPHAGDDNFLMGLLI